ncbi:stage II sporulation protein D [Clostridium cochlearium]|uniref:Stage II sporulation protein D n=1 Tax=Clostridium cochlearium TaxID=1494 RepID=A0A239Z2Y8_CLOCO|nr:stage II sporulation protein D [Clostridium cochlearium]MCR1972201.1 stage II sporulation protein D [Clostridium cochlearium]MDU1443218.1 stage II sporulation protein D [Clostridium cochlearium]SDL18786.1 stage II sporulation protein D [Clostridium cochlearium]SNV64884.1 stage II sporulation protein D [Clostridium cochlearium]SQB34316.1 stage II sporulation protein D [Clostridium cochlearium]
MRSGDIMYLLKRFFASILASILIVIIFCFIILKPSLIGKDNKNNISENKKIEEIKVKVYISKDKKIIELDLEDYIKGVVSAEMPAEFHEEALKAQAIAARTYAIPRIKQLGGVSCKNVNGADLCDTVHCQAFLTKEVRMKGWSEKKRNEYWNKIENAVESTAGEVLVYKDEIIKGAYYFSTSSGFTENGQDIFASTEPYLKSVKSQGEEIAPKYKSNKNYSYSEFINIINKKYPKSISNIKNIKNEVKIKSRTSGGSVKEIVLGKTIITGPTFRKIFNLNSSNFNIKFEKDKINIECKGYGHGVGMSQWGANVLGKSGENYKDILKHYYTGVEIKKYKEVLKNN